jgi:hypothetical protein
MTRWSFAASATGCELLGPFEDTISEVSVQCPAGTVVTGGGFDGHEFDSGGGEGFILIPADVHVTRSRQLGNGWRVAADFNEMPVTGIVTVTATCAATS